MLLCGGQLCLLTTLTVVIIVFLSLVDLLHKVWHHSASILLDLLLLYSLCLYWKVVLKECVLVNLSLLRFALGSLCLHLERHVNLLFCQCLCQKQLLVYVLLITKQL